MTVLTHKQVYDFITENAKPYVDLNVIRAHFHNTAPNALGMMLASMWSNRVPNCQLYRKNHANGSQLYWTDPSTAQEVEDRVIENELLNRNEGAKHPRDNDKKSVRNVDSQRAADFQRAVAQVCKPKTHSTKKSRIVLDEAGLARYDDPGYRGRKPEAWYEARGIPSPYNRNSLANSLIPEMEPAPGPVEDPDDEPQMTATPEPQPQQEEVWDEVAETEPAAAAAEVTHAVSEQPATTETNTTQSQQDTFRPTPHHVRKSQSAGWQHRPHIGRFAVGMTEKNELVITDADGTERTFSKEQTNLVASAFLARNMNFLRKLVTDIGDYIEKVNP